MPYGYGWFPFFYSYNYPSTYSRIQGTLYINFIDNKNQQLVWQGRGDGVLNEYSKDRDKMIGNFVTRILEKFPPTED